jgi:SAM-dependent methyltransferase
VTSPHAARVVAYYEAKTASILAKYGPGPRVHFHSGLADAAPPRDAKPASLRTALVAAQEEVLRDAARVWCDDAALAGDLLDVGCGIGGGALYWAMEHGARVTALTNVAAHVPLVQRFAAQAGVGDRVLACVGDAEALEGPMRFDAAVAIESSCYFDRDAFFASLARVLRPRARVHIVDCFAVRPASAARFDRYFLCRMGSLGDYERAAARAGFALEKSERLNARAAGFWALSQAWSRARLAEPTGANERARLLRSIAEHEGFRRAYTDGGVDFLRVTFARAS